MPEATSAGGGYSCQVCGSTYRTEGDLIQHGRESHPDRPVTWGDPRQSTVRSETHEAQTGSDVGDHLRETGEKMKAGAKALGEKISDPDADLKQEYRQKKVEEQTK